jgi:hypothetical protein
MHDSRIRRLDRVIAVLRKFVGPLYSFSVGGRGVERCIIIDCATGAWRPLSRPRDLVRADCLAHRGHRSFPRRRIYRVFQGNWGPRVFCTDLAAGGWNPRSIPVVLARRILAGGLFWRNRRNSQPHNDHAPPGPAQTPAVAPTAARVERSVALNIWPMHRHRSSRAPRWGRSLTTSSHLLPFCRKYLPMGSFPPRHMLRHKFRPEGS